MQLPIKNPSKGRVLLRDLTCLNCKKLLDKTGHGIDAKRFCSFECKEKYFQ